MLTEEQEATLLANVKSITDRMALVDEVFRQMKLGRNMVLAFICGHSGLYFPGNFLRDWGREFGIGLGPDPVSEVLNTDYHTPLPSITRDTRSIEQIAYGVESTRAQVDALLVDIDQVNREQAWAVLATEDPYIEKRMAIIRPRQLNNPLGGALRMLQTEWVRQNGGLK